MTPTPSLALVAALACRGCAVRRFRLADSGGDGQRLDILPSGVEDQRRLNSGRLVSAKLNGGYRFNQQLDLITRAKADGLCFLSYSGHCRKSIHGIGLCRQTEFDFIGNM